MTRSSSRLSAFILGLTVVLAGCATSEKAAERVEPASGLPPVAAVRGPLSISIVYPPDGAQKPRVDSTFVFGSVGSGDASLTINDLPVEVAENGAFLAFVPVPDDGRYVFEAHRGGDSAAKVYDYRRPAPAKTDVIEFDGERVGIVRTGSDTLATGSDVAYAMPSPEADRRWFFPRGAHLAVTGRMGNFYRVRLSAMQTAWIDSSAVSLSTGDSPQRAPLGPARLVPAARYVDIVLPADYAPFHIEAQKRLLGITLYDRRAPAQSAALGQAGVIEDAAWRALSGDSARLDLRLSQPLWGYKAFYDADGALVVRLRRTPAFNAARPLEGLRIMVDTGHPPGGAVGPTGYTEAEANLAIGKRLAAMLAERGATVLMPRPTIAPLVSSTSAAQELWARVDTAVALDADLLVSVHNNAFPNGVNPFLRYGSETYYYHPFSQGLAEALDEEIAAVTTIPDLGAKQRSLALVRPTWFPSSLTESLFMMFPRQEAALRNPQFLDRLARAHAAGIETFVRTYLSEE